MPRCLFAALAIVIAAAATAPAALAQERLNFDLSNVVSNTLVPPVLMPTIRQAPVTFDFDTSEFRRRDSSSALMTSLYVSTFAMQALDVHSTLLALDRGAVERNPMMGQVTQNTGAFIALKAGVAVSSVMAARNMSKRNKVAAALTLVAINSAYALVINHNYKVARSMR